MIIRIKTPEIKIGIETAIKILCFSCRKDRSLNLYMHYVPTRKYYKNSGLGEHYRYVATILQREIDLYCTTMQKGNYRYRIGSKVRLKCGLDAYRNFNFKTINGRVLIFEQCQQEPLFYKVKVKLYDIIKIIIKRRRNLISANKLTNCSN